MSELPINREDSDEVAEEFLKHWNPAILANKGLHRAVRDLMYRLQDHGDIIILKVSENNALSEWLCANDIGLEVFDAEADLPEELKSAVKKLLFSHGRCFGLTDNDMGIEETHEQ